MRNEDAAAQPALSAAVAARLLVPGNRKTQQKEVGGKETRA